MRERHFHCLTKQRHEQKIPRKIKIRIGSKNIKNLGKVSKSEVKVNIKQLIASLHIFLNKLQKVTVDFYMKIN